MFNITINKSRQIVILNNPLYNNKKQCTEPPRWNRYSAWKMMIHTLYIYLLATMRSPTISGWILIKFLFRCQFNSISLDEIGTNIKQDGLDVPYWEVPAQKVASGPIWACLLSYNTIACLVSRTDSNKTKITYNHLKSVRCGFSSDSR